MTFYYADQNKHKIQLLQTCELVDGKKKAKRYRLSDFGVDSGKIRALINCSFFDYQYVYGRNIGDEFNDAPDQSNFNGNHIVIFKDYSYKIGKFESGDWRDNVLASFSPIAIFRNGQLEIAPSIAKEWTPNNIINRTAICYNDDGYHFCVATSINYDDFAAAIYEKYKAHWIAFLDSGGSSEIIIDDVLQFKPSDDSGERLMWNGLAFIEENSPEPTKKVLFAPRLSKDGMMDNKYWYNKDYNAGVSDGKYDDSALANCVCYASGRFGELNNQNMRNIMKNRTGFGNACEWYRDTKYEKGSIAKVGAIACFGGTYGHVAIVERVNADGTVLVSQSNYEKVKQQYGSDNYFQTRTYKLEVGKVASGVGLVFQGYIYPPNIKGVVERDTNKDQIEIFAEKLRIRKTPNGNWVEGIFAPIGLFDVLEFKNEANYTWARLDENMWVALNDSAGWTKTYLKDTEDDKDKIIKELSLKISELKEEIEQNNKKIADLEINIKQAKNELNKANDKLARIKTKNMEMGDIIDE